MGVRRGVHKLVLDRDICFHEDLKNDNLNLLYEGNKECFMAIKTPSGQTDIIKLMEIVMQGSIWGPLCCTFNYYG